jgi:hypothetical protein
MAVTSYPAAGNQIVIDVPLPSSLDTRIILQVGDSMAMICFG